MPFLVYSKDNVDRSNMRKLTGPLSYEQGIFYLTIIARNSKHLVCCGVFFLLVWFGLDFEDLPFSCL